MIIDYSTSADYEDYAAWRNERKNQKLTLRDACRAFSRTPVDRLSYWDSKYTREAATQLSTGDKALARLIRELRLYHIAWDTVVSELRAAGWPARIGEDNAAMDSIAMILREHAGVGHTEAIAKVVESTGRTTRNSQETDHVS